MSDCINEREFEICFNSEFFRINIDSIVNFTIPSQREEYGLGYDVEFDIQNRGSKRSLFLQHKVSRIIPTHRIFLFNGADCFRFNIMKISKSPQHNLLVSLATRGESVFYCAPLFEERIDLIRCAREESVVSNSRLFSPTDMGSISDSKQHHVSYDIDGNYGFFESEPKKLSKIFSWKDIESIPIKDFSQKYLDDLKGKLSEILQKTIGIDEIDFPSKYSESTIFQIRYLLRTYYHLTWIII